ADGDAERLRTIARFPRRVLVNGVTGVDALAFEEEAPHRRAGAFRGDENDVDVLRRDDAGLVAEDDAEAVREVERLAGGEVRLEPRPEVLLARVGEQVLDDRAAPGRFLEVDERLAGLRALLLRELRALAAV